MQIIKQDDKLIIELPLWQTKYDALDEECGKDPNLYGVIAGDDFTLSQAISLGYKDDVQVGMPIVHLGSKEELISVCKQLGIEVIEYPLCDKCHKPIYGSFSWDLDGNKCFGCELKTLGK